MPTMTRNLLLSFIALVSLLSPSVGRADDAAAQATTESRLRDALRGAMLQLRDAQGQVATLQASQAQSDKDNADLKTKIDTLTSQIASLTKQSADDKAASDKAIADLKSQNADLTTQIAKLNDALAAWEKDDKQYIQLARDKEAARAQLAAQAIMLQRVIDDRETKNLALFNLGNDILTRYEKFSLGDALGAKEPFTGISRVKLQELVQDYKDKISDQRVTPGQAPTTPPVVPAGKKVPAQQETAATTTR
jgi:DNA repair exonuclease SbcCD ATPase subunit